MSNSTTNLDLIATGQANKEVTANSLFDAASPAMLYGRRAVTTAGLTWGYFGGVVSIGGVPTVIANGTVTLTASATNYVEADPATGTVSVNTSAFTAGKTRLYSVVTGESSAISYTDLRIVGSDGSAAASAAVAAHVAASDPHSQYALESTIGAAGGIASLGGDGKVPSSQLPASATSGGTVTSVALTTPGLLFDVAGSPVTTSGTLAMSLKTQAANKVLAGPATGTDAAPTMRSLVAADLPALSASSISDFSEAVDDRVGALLVAGTNVTLTYNDAGNTLTINSTAGGGGTPGGADAQVQFNDGGAFSGASAMTWNKATNVLTIGSTATPATIIGAAGATATDAGAAVTLKGGAGGSTSGNGGAVSILGGVPVAGDGGAINITAASGLGSGKVGGNVTITSGNGSGAASVGNVTLRGGTNSGMSAGGLVQINGSDGSITITAAASITAGPAGANVTMSAGAGGNSNNNGGAVSIAGGAAGTATTSNNGGALTLSGGTGGSTGAGGDLIFRTAATNTLTERARIDKMGNVILNKSGAALATTATNGFTYLPTCAGTPTGVPATLPTGAVPMVFDTSGAKIWIYAGGSWKGVAVA